MLRDEYLRRIIDAAHIEIYLSANDGKRIYWPWRMHPPKEANMGYRNACETYIIDSDPLDDSVTAKTVLDTAFRLDAEIASLQDVYQDKDATVDSLLQGLEVADSHQFNGRLLLPLQEPYVECWKELGEPTEHLLGIGGLKDANTWDRIDATKNLRSAVGEDVWIHGFGWGPTDKLAQAIRDQPNLLDSIDYSTPMQSVDFSYLNGKESMSVAAMQAGTQLVQDLRKCSSLVDHTSEDVRPENNTSLTDFQ